MICEEHRDPQKCTEVASRIERGKSIELSAGNCHRQVIRDGRWSRRELHHTQQSELLDNTYALNCCKSLKFLILDDIVDYK